MHIQHEKEQYLHQNDQKVIKNTNKTNFTDLLIEIWETIFSTLFYSIDVNDNALQVLAFKVANGTCRYLRNSTWRVRKGMIMYMPMTSMDEASRKGNVDLLSWWLRDSGLAKNKLELYYTTKAIGYAAEYNRINVLHWWNNSGLLMKYDNYALEKATEKSNKDVLDFWQHYNLRFIYTKCPLDIAIINGKIDIAEWWIKKSGQPMFFHHPASILIQLKLLVI